MSVQDDIFFKTIQVNVDSMKTLTINMSDHLSYNDFIIKDTQIKSLYMYYFVHVESLKIKHCQWKL